MQYRNSDSDDDDYIGGYDVEADEKLSHLKIGNRFGFKILTLDSRIDLCWPDDPDCPVPPAEMNRIIEGAN